ncbi:hypothetical protein JHW43_005084 [Diplocarpon mali]|nr:hypothetical protein JHW43_005084 [Diplocarpon mali]
MLLTALCTLYGMHAVCAVLLQCSAVLYLCVVLCAAVCCWWRFSSGLSDMPIVKAAAGMGMGFQIPMESSTQYGLNPCRAVLEPCYPATALCTVTAEDWTGEVIGRRYRRVRSRDNRGEDLPSTVLRKPSRCTVRRDEVLNVLRGGLEGSGWRKEFVECIEGAFCNGEVIEFVVRTFAWTPSSLYVRLWYWYMVTWLLVSLVYSLPSTVEYSGAAARVQCGILCIRYGERTKETMGGGDQEGPYLSMFCFPPSATLAEIGRLEVATRCGVLWRFLVLLPSMTVDAPCSKGSTLYDEDRYSTVQAGYLSQSESQCRGDSNQINDVTGFTPSPFQSATLELREKLLLIDQHHDSFCASLSDFWALIINYKVLPLLHHFFTTEWPFAKAACYGSQP